MRSEAIAIARWAQPTRRRLPPEAPRSYAIAIQREKPATLFDLHLNRAPTPPLFSAEESARSSTTATHPGVWLQLLGGTRVGAQYHLTGDMLRAAAKKLHVDDDAVQALIDHLGVLGYANGSPNSVAGSVTLNDLTAIRDQIDGGKSFAEVVQLAQDEHQQHVDRLASRLS